MSELDLGTLSQVLDRVEEGVLLVDRDEAVCLWNGTLADWTGVPSASAAGNVWAQLFDEHPGSAMRQAVRDALRHGLSTVITPALHDRPLPLGSGRRLRQRILVEPMNGGCLIRVQDASEVLEREARLAAQRDQLEEQRRALVEQQRAIHQAANFDVVTGLLNRSQVRAHLGRAIERSQTRGTRGAVMCFDVDGWRQVNETFGTDVADQALRRIGARLCREIRPMDIAGRLGGDDFMVVLEDLQPGEARDIARGVLEAVRRPFMVGEHELSVTLSGGIAFFPRHGQYPEDLLLRAESAVRHAKVLGRNRVQTYSTRLQVQSAERNQLLSGLQRAVDQGLFELHYQPQVDLRTGQVEGMEALLRWTHPDLGPISPARFVPVLEDCGLIIQVGEWVVRAAAKQAAKWSEQGHAFTVAVNVSAHQFLEPDFSQTVKRALSDVGLPPARLELELTESLLMKNVNTSRDMLRELSQAGFKIAIDDFGTGYSSLAHLRRFPVDALKIDRAFINGLSDPEGKAIVRTIVGLSRVLDLRVVAEGVEDVEQASFLAAEGCDVAQGFWIGRPVDVEALDQWLQSWRPGQVVHDAICSGSAKAVSPGASVRVQHTP